MAGDYRQEAYLYLLDLAAQKGYVTFDDIIDAADKWQLPINEVDWLSNSITTRGILVYDKAPEKANRVSDDDAYYDFAQSDYEEIFNRIIQLEPSLEHFVNEVRSIRPPQYKELSNIIYQAKEGNAYARNRIVEMHLRIALRIGLQRAEQYDTDIVDCIGDACLGLLMAVDKYDPDSSGPFGSYAAMWILQNVTRRQPTQRPFVYYPVHKKDIYFAAYPKIKENGFVPDISNYSFNEIKKWLIDNALVSDENVDDVVWALFPAESIENLIDEDEEDFRLSYDAEIESIVENRLLTQEIHRALSTLTEKEKRVLELRYGLIDGTARTLEEVGVEFDVTRERIRQIESKALRKLRHPSRRMQLIDFIELMPGTTIEE